MEGLEAPGNFQLGKCSQTAGFVLTRRHNQHTLRQLVVNFLYVAFPFLAAPSCSDIVGCFLCCPESVSAKLQ